MNKDLNYGIDEGGDSLYSSWENPFCDDADADDYNDDDFYAFLSEVVMRGLLTGAALGITKQVIERGLDSLSEKQRFVFNKYVLDKHTIP